MGVMSDGSTTRSVAPGSPPWWLIDSEVAGGPILVAAVKESFQAARQAHPGVPVFFGPEIETLAAFPTGEGRDRLVRAVVVAKRILGGWVVPPAAPAAK